MIPPHPSSARGRGENELNRMKYARASRFFPISLVLLTAAMGLWLEHVSRLGQFGRHLNALQPEHQAEDVVATSFDKQGFIEQRLLAQRLWRYPEQDLLYFFRSHTQVYQEGTLDYSVDAVNGYYDVKLKQVFFDRHVRLIKPAHEQTPMTIIDTSAMQLDTVKRYALSAKPVLVHYGDSVAQAIGFDYSAGSGILNLFSDVKVTWVPSPK